MGGVNRIVRTLWDPAKRSTADKCSHVQFAKNIPTIAMPCNHFYKLVHICSAASANARMYDVADDAKFWPPLAFRLLLRPNILCFSWNWKQTNVMEKLRALFDTFMSNYTDSEEVFKTANLERQVEILLKERVFDHLLEQVVPSCKDTSTWFRLISFAITCYLKRWWFVM